MNITGSLEIINLLVFLGAFIAGVIGAHGRVLPNRSGRFWLYARFIFTSLVGLSSGAVAVATITAIRPQLVSTATPSPPATSIVQTATDSPTSTTTTTNTLTPILDTPSFIFGDVPTTVRTEPIVGEIIISLSNQSLPITGVTANGNYYRVNYNGQEAWVSRISGRVEGDLNRVTVLYPILIIGEISIPIRITPDFEADIISIVSNQRLPITGICTNNNFYRILYDTQIAWIHAIYVGEIVGDVRTVPVMENEEC